MQIIIKDKLALRIWLFGKSSYKSLRDVGTDNRGGLDPADDGGCWEDIDKFSLDISEVCEEPARDFIAERTSPFKSVPWGPDDFNEDVSNPNSFISNFAEGLILLKVIFSVLSFFNVSSCIDFSFFAVLLDTVEGMFFISSWSSTCNVKYGF